MNVRRCGRQPVMSPGGPCMVYHQGGRSQKLAGYTARGLSRGAGDAIRVPFCAAVKSECAAKAARRFCACLVGVSVCRPLCFPGAWANRDHDAAVAGALRRVPAPQLPLFGGRIRTLWERFPLAGGFLRRPSCTTPRPTGVLGMDASVCEQQFATGVGLVHASWCVLRYPS